MNLPNYERRSSIEQLIVAYENLSRNGNQGLLAESEYHKLVDHFEDQCEFDKALEIVDAALRHFHFTNSFHIRKADLLLENNFFPEALASVERAIAFSPFDNEGHLLKAEILIRMGSMFEAEETLSAFPTELSAEDNARKHFLKGLIFEDQRAYRKMFFALKRSVLLDQGNYRSLERFWVATELSSLYEESIAVHLRVIDKNPYNFLAWYNLGHGYYYKGDLEEAFQAFEYSILIDPEFGYGYRDAAEVCIQMGQFHKTLEFCKDALKLIPEDGELFCLMGKAHSNLDQDKNAIECFAKSIFIEPENDYFHFQLGQVFSKQQHWQAATNSYLRALELDSRNEAYLTALGEAYLQNGESDKAVLAFRQATLIAPDDSYYWVRFAGFYLEAENPVMALEIIEEALMNTTGADLLYAKAACLFAMRKRKQAVLLVEDALAIDSDSYGLLFVLYPPLEEDPVVLELLSNFFPQ